MDFNYKRSDKMELTTQYSCGETKNEGEKRNKIALYFSARVHKKSLRNLSNAEPTIWRKSRGYNYFYHMEIICFEIYHHYKTARRYKLTQNIIEQNTSMATLLRYLNLT